MLIEKLQKRIEELDQELHKSVAQYNTINGALLEAKNILHLHQEAQNECASVLSFEDVELTHD